MERLTASPDVSDISGLAGMTTLRILHIAGNVSDITPLRDLVHIHDLDISGTRAADLTPLKGHTELRTLQLASTAVSDLSPLAGIPLQSINVANTSVTSLQPLQTAGLTTLDCSGTGVSDLTPVANAVALEVLAIDDTQVQSVEALRAATTLHHLRIAGTPIDDLEPLRKVTSLRRFQLDRSKVRDLAALSDLALESVEARGIPATNFADLGLSPSATVFTSADPEALVEATRRHPGVDFKGTWRVSTPRPGVVLRFVTPKSTQQLDAEQTRYLLHCAALDGGVAPDLGRWHDRLLRRSGASAPPPATDEEYWSRFLRVADQALAAAPGLGRHKFTQPGRWSVSSEDVKRLVKSLQQPTSDGATEADQAFLTEIRDWLEESGGFECWVLSTSAPAMPPAPPTTPEAE